MNGADEQFDRPLSVMLLISSLEHGGAERQVVEYVRALNRERVQPFICSLSEKVPLASLLPNPSSELVIAKKRSRFDVTTIFKVIRIMRMRKVDVVHAFLFDAEIVARLSAPLAGVPVVIASERNADYVRPLLHKLGHRLTRPLFDAMIANSYAGKRFNLRSLGIPDEMIHVIHNGVDTTKFYSHPQSGQVLRNELGVTSGEFIVGMIASFKKQKKHDHFLKTACLVLKSLPNVRFVLVGEPLSDNQQGSEHYFRDIKQLAETLRLQERCLFLGNRNDMLAVYNACDVTILTSEREGTPNVLLESMACGVPVIATDVSDNSKIIRDGVTGYVVPFGDTEIMAQRITELLANDSKRIEMGRAAAKSIKEEFSMTLAAKKTEDVYWQYFKSKNGTRSS